MFILIASVKIHILLLFFFFSCRFIQDWLFHGSYHDVYGEFSIQFSQDYLKCRGNISEVKNYVYEQACIIISVLHPIGWMFCIVTVYRCKHFIKSNTIASRES